jgi:hypothetical protein
MDIQTEKLEIMKMILETDNPGILDSIKKIFKKENSVDFWETLSQDQKDEIRMGIDEIENGETIDYEDLIKKHR